MDWLTEFLQPVHLTAFDDSQIFLYIFFLNLLPAGEDKVGLLGQFFFLAKASSSFNNPANYCRSGNSNCLYNKCVRSALLFDTLISKLCFVDRLRKHSNAEWSLLLFKRVNSKATLAKRLTQTLHKCVT